MGTTGDEADMIGEQQQRHNREAAAELDAQQAETDAIGGQQLTQRTAWHRIACV